MAFYPIVFLQGDDATEAMEILETRGEAAALAHLMQWETLDEAQYHFPDSGAYREHPYPWGTQDKTYKEQHDGKTYWLTWYSGIPYISLCRQE